MMPGRNGGRLRRGSSKGNTPGPGRPRDVIRAAYAELLTEYGVALIRDILAGRVTVPLEQQCEHCGKRPKSKSTAVVDVTPDLALRLRAVAEINRYCLTEKEELTTVHPEVVVRIRRQIELIASRPSWDSQALLDALGEQVWT
jgi:hypothetical protein